MAVTLLDIADVGEPITLRGKEYTVQGVSAEVLAELMANLPQLRMLIAGKSLDDDLKAALIAEAPEVVGAVLVAALGGDWRNPAEVAAARKLTAGEQMQIIEIGIRLTLPQGAQNFIEGLDRLSKINGGPIKEAVTKSPDSSNG